MSAKVSYKVFWYEHDRWNDLELFFASLAADRIIRREIPGQAFANPRSGRYDYYLVLSESQETKLGNGIQMAILAFCEPDEGQHRIRLREENVHVAGVCTIERNDLFPSHRVEGSRAGRFAAVIGREQVPPGKT